MPGFGSYRRPSSGAPSSATSAWSSSFAKRSGPPGGSRATKHRRVRPRPALRRKARPSPTGRSRPQFIHHLAGIGRASRVNVGEPPVDRRVQSLALLGVDVVPSAGEHLVEGDELDDLPVGQIGGFVQQKPATSNVCLERPHGADHLNASRGRWQPRRMGPSGGTRISRYRNRSHLMFDAKEVPYRLDLPRPGKGFPRAGLVGGGAGRSRRGSAF